MVIGQSQLSHTLISIQIASEEINSNQFRTNRQCLIVISQCLVVFMLPLIGKSSVQISKRISRIQCDRLTIVSHRQIILTLFVMCVSAIVIGRGVLWIQENGFVIVLYGLDKLSLTGIKNSTIKIRGGILSDQRQPHKLNLAWLNHRIPHYGKRARGN